MLKNAPSTVTLLYNALRPAKFNPFARGSKRAKSPNERFNVGKVVIELLETVVAAPVRPELITEERDATTLTSSS